MEGISLFAYIPINIDPIIVTIGPVALRWYRLMYVVGIVIGLWAIRGYTRRKGIHANTVYRLLWWCIVAGLLGGRLYYVVQQPNFVSYYLAQPQHILATWEGGMAFFGAIFLVIPTIFWRSKVERINPLVAIDVGYSSPPPGKSSGASAILSTGVSSAPRSRCPGPPCTRTRIASSVMNLAHPSQCGNVATAVQPAAAYELLANIALWD
jgi:phosphatidylglycerol:prolipoprotein diacylglycerol transferase